ncbi:MAG: carboxypeptidase-like regulatory domain-containing protein [Nitrospinales bacterium]
MRRISFVILLFLGIAIAGCGGGGGGGGSGDSHTPMGTLSVNVVDAIDYTSVNDANIIVYDSSNILVTRGLTVNGNFDYSLSPGTYTIIVAAQDYLPVPSSNQNAVPFEIIDGKTTSQNVALDEHPDAGTTGQISGYTLTPAPDSNGISGVLVVAKDDALSLSASAITGPDGDYVIYNVTLGNYTLEAYLAGYRETSTPVTVDVVVADSYDADDIEMEVHANADLYGKVTFLSVVNGVVDITLVHPDTLDTIPGLSTQNQASGLTYLLSSVPPGTYIAWASFRNDLYVMDPDSIRKFGLPEVVFTAGSGDLEQNFDVTNAVTITGPTNELYLVVPVEVNTATPTFTWEKYPSAKEYIIEVFNSNGETIWGGYDGITVQHTQIGQNETSAVFDFDGSATAALQDGEVYRWKIYADNDATQDIQGLISSSEDQLGLFKYGAQSLTITGESGNQVNLNGTWYSGCDADIADGESEIWTITVSGSTFTQVENIWFDSTTCSGSSDVTVTMTGTVTFGDEVTASMNGSNVTATEADVDFSSYTGTINNPDLVAGFNADEECGFDDWVVDTPKELLGTTCMPNSSIKDVIYIDDTVDPDVWYNGDGEGLLDANGYPTEIDLDSEKERM